MRATSDPAQDEGTAGTGAARGGGPLRALTWAALLACALGFLVWSGARDRSERWDAPPLPAAPARCGVVASDPEELAAYARQVADAARASIARYPFDAAEGLPALARLAEAAACDARSVQAKDLAAFEPRVRRDYRDRVLRVRHALGGDRLRWAEDDLAYLAALLAHESSPFARRVRNLQASLADGAGTRSR